MNRLDNTDDDPSWPLIVCTDGRPVGLGSWVSCDRVLTCAHLLDSAKRPDRPQTDVRVAPLFVERRPVRAEVIGWEPDLDLALLATDQALPAGQLPELRYAERLGFAHGIHRWKAWGIPVSAVGQLGRSVSGETALRRIRAAVRSGSGVVADKVGKHRYQLLTEDEPRFEGGFSGSAVRTESGAVVGVLTSRTGAAATSRIGFLVSIDGAVAAFPELRRHIGWQFDTDSRLRAAWRWEDDDLARPTLGSYFTGRTSALGKLFSFVEKSE